MAVPQSIHDGLPLDESQREIRLLRFNKPVDSLVNVSMIKGSLNDPNLSYNAMSYCWGNPVFDHSIICNGKTIKITAGLFAALRRLQHFPGLTTGYICKDYGETLWVDQLCINQSDDDEKSSQVQIMKDIYSGCKICLAYLGEEDTNISLALAYVKSRVSDENFEGFMRLALDGDGDLGFAKMGYDDRDMPISAADDVDGARAVGYLIDRPYFERGWIVQEYVLSSFTQAVCGQYVYSLDAIGQALVMNGRDDSSCYSHTLLDVIGFSHHSNFVSSFIDLDLTKILWRTQSGSTASEGLTLFSLVITFRSRKVADQRDKIYAHMSMASDHELYPAARYDLDVEEVYRAFGEASIRVGRGLDMIQHASASDRGALLSLPSWVPNWSTEASPLVFDLTGLHTLESSAAQDSVTLGETPGSIDVEAHYISLLEEVHTYSSAPLETPEYEDKWRRELFAMQQFILKFEPPDAGTAHISSHLCSMLHKASWNAVAAGEIFSTSHREVFMFIVGHSKAGLRSDFLKILSGKQCSDHLHPRDCHREFVLLRDIRKMVRLFTAHCTLARTTAGEIAVVPIAASAGDEIVWFRNALALYTLRRNSDACTYQPIGGAYLESWVKDVGSDFTWEKITLV